jgi:predicted Fe-Mo cluster-binding NifX family protein
MKTVITSSGNSIDAGFDRRFGRAAWFCIYDENSGAISFHDNEQIAATNGAGTRAAEKMAEWGVEKVISGDFGPKAKDMLDRFNIQMVILREENLSLEQIIDKLKSKTH